MGKAYHVPGASQSREARGGLMARAVVGDQVRVWEYVYAPQLSALSPVPSDSCRAYGRPSLTPSPHPNHWVEKFKEL